MDKIEVFGRLSHNPYFNRWFSAISRQKNERNRVISHNPYFNRWFSAIDIGQTNP